MFQSQRVVGTQDGDGDGDTRTFASSMAMSEEVNGTADDAEEEYRSESHGEDAGGVDIEDEDEEGYQHPGEASIGKKLWKFFTT